MIKRILIIILLSISNILLSQETIWIDGTDTTQKDTLIFLTGVSKESTKK